MIKKASLSKAISDLMDAMAPANKCILMGRLDDPENDKVTYSDAYAVIVSRLVAKMRDVHEQITSINALLNAK